MNPYFLPFIPRERFAVELPPSFPPFYFQYVFGPDSQFRSPAVEAASRALHQARNEQILINLNGGVNPVPRESPAVQPPPTPAPPPPPTITDFQSADFRHIMRDLRQCRGILDGTTRNLHSYMCTSMSELTQHRIQVERRLFGLQFENARLRERLRIMNIQTETEHPDEMNKIFTSRWNSLLGSFNQVQEDRIKMNDEMSRLHEVILRQQEREAQREHHANLPYIPQGPENRNLVRDYGFLQRPPDLGQIHFQPLQPIILPPCVVNQENNGRGEKLEDDNQFVVDERPRPPEMPCQRCAEEGCQRCAEEAAERAAEESKQNAEEESSEHSEEESGRPEESGQRSTEESSQNSTEESNQHSAEESNQRSAEESNRPTEGSRPHTPEELKYRPCTPEESSTRPCTPEESSQIPHQQSPSSFEAVQNENSHLPLSSKRSIGSDDEEDDDTWRKKTKPDEEGNEAEREVDNQPVLPSVEEGLVNDDGDQPHEEDIPKKDADGQDSPPGSVSTISEPDENDGERFFTDSDTDGLESETTSSDDY